MPHKRVTWSQSQSYVQVDVKHQNCLSSVLRRSHHHKWNHRTSNNPDSSKQHEATLVWHPRPTPCFVSAVREWRLQSIDFGIEKLAARMVTCLTGNACLLTDCRSATVTYAWLFCIQLLNKLRPWTQASHISEDIRNFCSGWRTRKRIIKSPNDQRRRQITSVPSF